MGTESPIVDHNAKRKNKGTANTFSSKGAISNNNNNNNNCNENKNKNTVGKRSYKPIIIAFIVVISVPFLIAAGGMLYYFSEESVYESDYSYDALEYSDDRIVVFTDYDSDEGVSLLDTETLEEYLSDFGATIYDDSMEDIGIYYVELDSSYSYEEICDICDQLEGYDGIDIAYPYYWEASVDVT